MVQTYLVVYEGENFREFYRYNLKTLAGVLAREKRAINSCYSGIKKDDDRTQIIVYKTDYATTDDKIVYKNTVKKFMEEK